MTGRRTYALALVLLTAGGALALLAAQAPWLRVTTNNGGGVTAPAPGLPEVRLVVESKGTAVAGSVVALALLALAGVLAVVATRGWLRRAVGGLLVLAGAGIGWTSLDAFLGRHEFDGRATAAADGHPVGDVLDVAVTWWPVVALVGGLLVVAGGVLVAWRGGTWSAMSARYDAPAPRAADRPGDAWAALDRGEDPTVEPDGQSGSARARARPHPDSSEGAGDLP